VTGQRFTFAHQCPALPPEGTMAAVAAGMPSQSEKITIGEISARAVEVLEGIHLKDNTD